MAALPGVALRAAQFARAVVPELLRAVVHAGIYFAGDFGTVVTRENHMCVVGDAGAPQRFEHLADGPVGLHHEIAVVAGTAPALELRRRHDGVMRRGEGEVEEEGSARLGGVFDPLDGVARELGQNVHKFPAGEHRTGMVEAVGASGVGQRGKAGGALSAMKQ